MNERNGSTLTLPGSEPKDVLSDILRQGARKLLADAVEGRNAETAAKVMWEAYERTGNKSGNTQQKRAAEEATRREP